MCESGCGRENNRRSFVATLLRMTVVGTIVATEVAVVRHFAIVD
jgi:hypothetical protein